jgi:hypothetical protein
LTFGEFLGKTSHGTPTKETTMATTIDPKAGSASMSDIVLESMQELQNDSDPTLSMEPEYLDEPMSDTDIEKELAGTTGETTEEGTQVEAAAKPAGTGDLVDTVRVEIGDGKFAKIKVDFSDKEAVKSFIAEQYAAARRAESLAKEVETIRPDYTDLKTSFEKIEAAAEEGPEALVDLLYGKEGSFKALIDAEIQRREARQYASPEELALMEREEQARKTQRLTQKEKKQLEAERQAIQSERAKAQEDALYSRLERQFNAVRVDGLFGDSDLEEFVNKAIWQSSIDELAKLEEKNPNIPDAAIKQVMSDIAGKVRNKFSKTQKEVVSKAVESSKTSVQQKVAAKATSAATPSRQAAQDAVNSRIDAGDIRGLTRLLLRGQ